MNQQLTNGNTALEPTIRALQQLSPQSQETIISLVGQLAQREGIGVPLSASPGLQTPIEGIPLWVAKLMAERYSERTVHMYRYLARQYLEKDPVPTKFGIQSYLADRLSEVSPALVSNERKALASQFLKCYSATRGLVCRGDGEMAMARVDTRSSEIATKEAIDTKLREISCQVLLPIISNFYGFWRWR